MKNVFMIFRNINEHNFNIRIKMFKIITLHSFVYSFIYFTQLFYIQLCFMRPRI